MVTIANSSFTQDGPGAGSTNPPGLYARYVHFLNEELQTVLSVVEDPEMRALYREELTPESESGFLARLAGMGPTDREAFIDRVNLGFRAALDRELESLRLPLTDLSNLDRGIVPPELIDKQSRGLLTPSLDAWVKACQRRAATPE